MRQWYRHFSWQPVNFVAGRKAFLLAISACLFYILLRPTPWNTPCQTHYDVYYDLFDNLRFWTPIKMHGTTDKSLPYCHYYLPQEIHFSVLIKSILFLSSLHTGMLEPSYNAEGTEVLESSPLHLHTINVSMMHIVFNWTYHNITDYSNCTTYSMQF